jgi:hypothetical protein
VETTFEVRVLSLAQRVAAVPASGTSTLKLFANETVSSPIVVVSGQNIGLEGNGDAMRTIKLGAQGRLFTVNSGGALALLNNVTLDGSGVATNNAPLVYVSGSLSMGLNATITGNNNANGNGGGVYLATGASLTTLGGSITGNKAVNGGGIYQAVGSRTVNLMSGSITGNTATNGGGIYVASGELSPAYGCTISGNTASGLGGGVYVAATAGLSASLAVITGNLQANGATLFGRDVYVHCSGTNAGHITVGDQTQIGNLCLFANSSANSSITLASGTYSRTTQIIASLDLMGDDPQMHNVTTMWAGQGFQNSRVVITPGVLTTAQANNRIVLGYFWNGSVPYESMRIVINTGSYTVILNGATGTLARIRVI